MILAQALLLHDALFSPALKRVERFSSFITPLRPRLSAYSIRRVGSRRMAVSPSHPFPSAYEFIPVLFRISRTYPPFVPSNRPSARLPFFGTPARTVVFRDADDFIQDWADFPPTLLIVVSLYFFRAFRRRF